MTLDDHNTPNAAIRRRIKTENRLQRSCADCDLELTKKKRLCIVHIDEGDQSYSLAHMLILLFLEVDHAACREGEKSLISNLKVQSLLIMPANAEQSILRKIYGI